jgi:hypothetical protein
MIWKPKEFLMAMHDCVDIMESERDADSFGRKHVGLTNYRGDPIPSIVNFPSDVIWFCSDIFHKFYFLHRCTQMLTSVCLK